MNKNFLCISLLVMGSFFLGKDALVAQDVAIVVEVENATLGTDFQTLSDGSIQYITISSDLAGGNPGNVARVATVTIDFPAAATYDLYIRLRVGAESFNDDSFYYGNGFGEKSPMADEEWIRVNNIANAGYAVESDIVEGAGGAGTQTWKWINLTEFMGDEVPATFEVTEGNLTQVLQIGGRENGLDIDKIAFARSDYFYTVNELENGIAGAPDRDRGPGTPPIAAGASKFLGNVYSGSQLSAFTNYWNQVTPENAGKWGSIESTRDVMNWNGMDAAYNLAKDNGFPIRFHVLIWGNQQPSWMENLSTAEQLEEIKEWFQAVANRYPELDYIEVVNEPLHDPPRGAGNGNYIEALGGTGTTGWDWVLESFRMARQYFPGVKLMINDYNIVNSSSNTQTYLEIINLLRAENLIDGIGVQGHAFSTRGSTSEMRLNLNRLGGTGLPIQVTELDIDGPSDQTQLSDYQRIFPVFWEHQSVEGITLWGFRPGLWRNEQRAYIIETDGITERPALVWLRSYVQGTIATNTFELQKSDHITVYPNPVNEGIINVEGMNQIDRAEIYNLAGKLIWSAQPYNNRLQVQGEIPVGLYFLKLYQGASVFSKKIVFE